MNVIGIVILNYNGAADTIECLTSVLPAAPEGTRVVVVDNASTDRSFEAIFKWLTTYCERCALVFECGRANNSDTNGHVFDVALIRAEKNRGFSAGNNIGIAYLESRGGCRYYWLLNNDTVIATNAVRALTSFADAHSSMGLIGSTIVDYNDRDRVQCAGGALYSRLTTRTRSALAGVMLSTALTSREPAMNYICGAAMLIRREVFADVGYLDERYFLYYEEIDYSRRALTLGHRLGWCRESIVFHKGGATTNAGSKSKSPLSEYHSNLSCLKYIAKFESTSRLVVIAATRLFLKSTFLGFERRWNLYRALMKAYLDFARTLG